MNMHVIDLKTDSELLDALRSAKTKLTADEALEQRVSFVYGSMKSNNSLTKEQLKKAILEQESA
jgi:hypothetical protein